MMYIHILTEYIPNIHVLHHTLTVAIFLMSAVPMYLAKQSQIICYIIVGAFVGIVNIPSSSSISSFLKPQPFLLVMLFVRVLLVPPVHTASSTWILLEAVIRSRLLNTLLSGYNAYARIIIVEYLADGVRQKNASFSQNVKCSL
jgi:hypothetical protein